MSLTLKGYDQLLEHVKRLPEAVQERIGDALMETAQNVENQARARAPVFTGRLKSEFSIWRRSRLKVRISSLPPYALAVESGYFGRGGQGNRGNRFPATKRGGKWRAQPELEAWALAHGLPPWPVARKIFLKGHKATPFMFDALEAEEAAFLDLVKKAVLEGSEGPTVV